MIQVTTRVLCGAHFFLACHSYFYFIRIAPDSPSLAHCHKSTVERQKLVTTDDGIVVPFLQLLQAHGVHHLGVLHANEEYGNQYVHSLRAAATSNNYDMEIVSIDVPRSTADTTDEDWARAVGILKETGYRYILVLHTSHQSCEPLLSEAARQGMAGDGKHVWIFTDGINRRCITDIEAEPGSDLERARRGLGRVFSVGEIDGISPTYDKFVDTYAAMGNHQDVATLRSLQPSYQEEISVESVSKLTSSATAFLYDATIALGLAACDALMNSEQNRALGSFQCFQSTELHRRKWQCGSRPKNGHATSQVSTLYL